MLYPVGLHAAVWFAPGAELPQGSLMSSAPQIKTQHSQYSQYSQSAPPAAAQQTATAMQNFGAKNYPRAFRGLSGGQPVPLTGRATHPTATWLFLPSFFSPGKKADGADVGGEGFFETGNGFKEVEFEVELIEPGGEFDNDSLFFAGEGNGGGTAVEGVHFAVNVGGLD